jgi:hypothetical protein
MPGTREFPREGDEDGPVVGERDGSGEGEERGETNGAKRVDDGEAEPYGRSVHGVKRVDSWSGPISHGVAWNLAPEEGRTSQFL